MAEYIEREAVGEPFDCDHVTVNGELYLRHRDVAAFLNSLPAADVAPVVHGRWICNYLDNYSCSVCGVRHNLYVGRTKFCHNCGARMDGE